MSARVSMSAPQLMASIAEPAGKSVCDACLRPSNALVNHDGDWLCPNCRAVFWAATVLFDQGITKEDTLIPTLLFAKAAGGSKGWEELTTLVNAAREHTGLELVRIMH